MKLKIAEAGKAFIDHGNFYFKTDKDLELVPIDDGYLTKYFIYKFLNIPYTIKINLEESAAYYKTLLIKNIYSNDDLIAIILNKDNNEESLEKYNNMQGWREWAGRIADRIVLLRNEAVSLNLN